MTYLLFAVSMVLPPAGPSGAELLDRCQSAYDAVRTLEVKASTKQGSLSADAHLFYSKPGKLRVFGKGLAVKYDLVVTPGEIWFHNVVWEKQENLVMAISGVSSVSGQAATYLPPLLLKERWGNLMSLKKYPLTVTEERLDGMDTYKLKAQGPNTTMSIWFDKRTYFIARVHKPVAGGAQDVRFGPYKVNHSIPASTFTRS